jgi:hypothetical protein
MRDDETSFNNPPNPVVMGDHSIHHSPPTWPREGSVYQMEAGRKYALVMLFVERAGEDSGLLHWKTPGSSSSVPIPHDAFCTGWARMTGNVLRVFFTWPLMPDKEVTFTVVTVPNPSFPQSAVANVASSIKTVRVSSSIKIVPSSTVSQVFLVNSVAGFTMQISSGSYPAILTTSEDSLFSPPGSVFLELSSSAAAATDVTMTGKITPTAYIPAFSSLVITIHGAVFPSGTTEASASIYVEAQGEAQSYHISQFNPIPRYVTKRIFFEKFEKDL